MAAVPAYMSLDNILGADLQSTVIGAAFLGVLFHHCIRKVEIDSSILELLGGYLVVLSCLLYAHVFTGECHLIEAVMKTFWTAVSFNAGLGISILAYRLLFHPLRRFPGPLLAKVSRFYNIWVAYKSDLRFHLVLEDWHKRWGDVVRTGPRELSILRASAIDIIYSSYCRKSTWYEQGALAPDCSIQMVTNVQDHKRRRKVWDHALSRNVISTYKPRIESQVDRLIAKLEQAARAEESVDMTSMSMRFAFDVMGLVGFSKDFGNLSTGREHEAMKEIRGFMSAVGRLGATPWLLHLITRVTGLARGSTFFFDWCKSELNEKIEAWSPDKAPQDIVSNLVNAWKERDRSAPPSIQALDEEGRTVVIAGSDTNGATLCHVLFFLARYPEVLRKLQAQLDQAGPQDQETDHAVSYLKDTIKETLRLKPPVPSAVPRITPPNGIQIDEIHVPGDMIVFVPIRLVQRDPRYYQKPDEFIPERWGEKKEELINGEPAFLAFCKGMYRCPGEALSLIILQSAVSRIVQRFDISFAPGETGESLDTMAQDTFSTTLPPVYLKFTPRETK